jgi:endogenous inhibitor of DNA gyrase (YacG/DUF329 family)
MGSHVTPAPTPSERLFFKCPACGLTLALDRHLAGVTGPCPACGTSVTAPQLPTVPPARNPQQHNSRRSRGRIIADSAIDHGHLERRESFRTLRIFLLAVLTFCACLLVTWFMKDWISR